jgi:tRNA A-37 threonylcarbamoyl transferase component Bud32
MARHGRYKIVRKVADGGMAEIFLAMQLGREGFQKPVILKRIHSTIYADPQFRNMFLDEAHISMSLSHSNIVQVLDLGVSAGRYFLVMEVVDGWDLGRVLHRATQAGTLLPRELGLYVTAEVCRALAYAHGKVDPGDGHSLGIVHRDVSPQNILLSEQGEVKLTDFGIAKAMNKREQTGTGVVKGKVAFMSPEQALGKPIDARSDLFALGTVLYQLMVRVRPFEAPTDLEILLRVQRADFRSAHDAAPDLPREVTSIIDKAMQLEPDLRYQSADEMLTDIEKVLRSVFRPVGQTELKRWLAALGVRDGLPPMSKAAATPTPGRATGTGERGSGSNEMEGKDVVLMDSASDVDGEEATSLASLDGPGGEMRPRFTRQRSFEVPLPVPDDGEAALSGRHAPLEFPLLAETEERPGRRRARRSGGMWLLFVGVLFVGGAAAAGRYFGLMREKVETPTEGAAGGAGDPGGNGGAAAGATEADRAAKSAGPPDAGAAGERPALARKSDENEPAHESTHHTHAASERAETARRINELKDMMAPDPSLEPAPPPAPSEAAPTPAPAPPPPAPPAATPDNP